MTTGSDNKDEAKGHQLQSKQREIISATTSVCRQQTSGVCLAQERGPSRPKSVEESSGATD